MLTATSVSILPIDSIVKDRIITIDMKSIILFNCEFSLINALANADMSKVIKIRINLFTNDTDFSVINEKINLNTLVGVNSNISSNDISSIPNSHKYSFVLSSILSISSSLYSKE